MENGKPHDGRAPDYDDWSLNADIVVYYPVLDIALELSSMGIRVDKDALLSQLKKAGCEERAKLPYQQSVINGELPFTIGGGSSLRGDHSLINCKILMVSGKNFDFRSSVIGEANKIANDVEQSAFLKHTLE